MFNRATSLYVKPVPYFLLDTFTEPGTGAIDLNTHTGEIGASWTKHPHANYTTAYALSLDNDLIYSSATAMYYASAVPPSADYYVEAEFELLSAVTQNVAVCARVLTTDDTMYFARLNNGAAWQMFKRVGGTATSLGSGSTNQLPGVGGIKTGRLVVDGDQISFYVNGTLEIGPITDTSISAAGRVGVRNAGSSTATTGAVLTSIRAGAL